MLAPNSRTYLTLRPDSTALRRARTARCPMPPMEPVAATDKAAMKWAEEKAKPVDATKEVEEDAKDEEVWKVYTEEDGEDCLDMQQMKAL